MRVPVVVSLVHDVRVAVEARRVGDVSSTDVERAGEGPPLIDAAVLLGLPPYPRAVRRAVVRLTADDGSTPGRLILGASASYRTFDPASFQPLPDLISALRGALGLAAVVVDGEELWFVLDGKIGS